MKLSICRCGFLLLMWSSDTAFSASAAAASLCCFPCFVGTGCAFSPLTFFLGGSTTRFLSLAAFAAAAAAYVAAISAGCKPLRGDGVPEASGDPLVESVRTMMASFRLLHPASEGLAIEPSDMSTSRGACSN